MVIPNGGNSVSGGAEKTPITSIHIVTNKAQCPQGHEVLAKASDDPQLEADLWKDSFMSFSRVYRYLCISRSYQEGQFVFQVVGDLALINERDLVPPGFTQLEFTQDTREKALRKKMICVRWVPRETALDAVVDIKLLARQKRPPPGYTLAGEIDGGVLLCFKYGVVSGASGGQSAGNAAAFGGGYPVAGLPYPIRPGDGSGTVNNSVDHLGAYMTGNMTLTGRAPSSGVSPAGGKNTPLDGVPFELSPYLRAMTGGAAHQMPQIKECSRDRLNNEFSYPFSVEQSVLQETFET